MAEGGMAEAGPAACEPCGTKDGCAHQVWLGVFIKLLLVAMEFAGHKYRRPWRICEPGGAESIAKPACYAACAIAGGVLMSAQPAVVLLIEDDRIKRGRIREAISTWPAWRDRYQFAFIEAR